jgi:hypothetical protein
MSLLYGADLIIIAFSPILLMGDTMLEDYKSAITQLKEDIRTVWGRL